MTKPIGPGCNLNCTYCYYLEKKELYPATRHFRMSEHILETFIHDYIDSQAKFDNPEIWFAWQGGEPTLLGVAYFQRIVDYQKKFRPAGRTIRNAFQTNGTLLDKEWAAFFKMNNFLVGLSIDGPRQLHDRYRLDRSGRSTFDRVMNSLDLLRSHEIEYNALTVVHRRNSRTPREVYQFLKRVGFEYIQFIPIVERYQEEPLLAGPLKNEREIDHGQITPWSVQPVDYGTFLTSVFDEWVKEDVGRIFVQFFDVQLGAWSGRPAGLCWFEKTCGRGLALEHNGDLYACDHYVYPEFRLGNIVETSLTELASCREQIRFGKKKQTDLPHFCRICEFRFACNGGCPKHRISRTPDNEPGLNYFCQSFKKFFTHAGPSLQVMTNLLRQGRPASDIMSMRPPIRPGKTPKQVKIGRNQPCPCGSGKKYKRCCGR